MRFLFYFIFIVGAFSSLRIIWSLILANVHQLITISANSNQNYRPMLSIIIPAYNEEKMIRASVLSALQQTYPNRQVIVVNDGSTDGTLSILQDIAERLKRGQIAYKNDSPLPLSKQFIVVNQVNAGKSSALNNGIKNYAVGELVTILDADSQLAPNASAKMVNHFKNPRVIAMADNVRIKRSHKFIELVQQIEYMLGYRLKGAEQLLGLEYIIGGVGSTFRMTALQAVDYYDSDTVTEDIDLTLKLIRHFGNRQWLFGYAGDAVAYTPPVHNFWQLIRQRYRWKYGRFQAIFKYRYLIANFNLRKYTVTLTWWKLPKIFVEESFMLLDPLFIAWMLWLIVRFTDFSMLVTIATIYFVFALVTFLVERLKAKQKIALLLLSPLAYVFLYIINVVDFICLLRCLANSKKLLFQHQIQRGWQHVDR